MSAGAAPPLCVADVGLLGPGVPRVGGHQLGDDVDGDREHDRAVVLSRDTVQGLQVPFKIVPQAQTIKSKFISVLRSDHYEKES